MRHRPRDARDRARVTPGAEAVVEQAARVEHSSRVASIAGRPSRRRIDAALNAPVPAVSSNSAPDARRSLVLIATRRPTTAWAPSHPASVPIAGTAESLAASAPPGAVTGEDTTLAKILALADRAELEPLGKDCPHTRRKVLAERLRLCVAFNEGKPLSRSSNPRGTG